MQTVEETEQRADRLIRNLEQLTLFERVGLTHAVMFQPIDLKRTGPGGAVTGLILTGTTFGAIIEYLYGPTPQGGPKVEVESVTLTLDMFETLLHLIDQRKTARRQAREGS